MTPAEIQSDTITRLYEALGRRDGDLVADQVDTFSLRRSGSQALGARGTALGAVGLLGRAVRGQARGNLERYRRE